MIVDGKLIRKKLEEKIVKKLQGKPQKKVCFVIFGDDKSSNQFISIKCKFAELLGVSASVFRFSGDLSESEAIKIVEEVSKKDFDGIVIQLPLPKNYNVQKILNIVPPNLDIDVLGEEAKKMYLEGNINMIPPVSRAVFEILDFHNVSLDNKNILVVGGGRLVGEPVSMTLNSKNISFNCIDKETPKDLQEQYLKSADIIISGAGSPHIITPDMLKDGVVLIDAGTSEQNGKLVGDFDPNCSKRASVFTPVPNGVGPVTLASLFLNL